MRNTDQYSAKMATSKDRRKIVFVLFLLGFGHGQPAISSDFDQEIRKSADNKFGDSLVLVSCAKDLSKGQIISYEILKRSLVKSSPPDTIYDAFIAVGRPARHPLVAGRPLKFSDCFSEGGAFTSSRGRRSVDCTGASSYQVP